MNLSHDTSKLTAQPTEYERVLLRSKSEATFARNLTLSGFLWEYEPERFMANDGWCPDFWAVSRGRDKTKNHLILSVVVEYKPCPVTDAYLNTLAQHFESLRDRLHGHIPVIACGSSFNRDQPRSTRQFIYEHGWVESEHRLNLFKHIDEALQYRFDLNQCNGINQQGGY